MRRLDQLKRSTYRTYSSLLFPPVVVFVAIACVTLWTWQSSRNALNDEINSTIEIKIRNTTASINQRLGTYESVLLGGAGLFRASENVTQKEWQEYINAYDLSQFKGIHSVGFARVVLPEDDEEVESFMAAQGALGFQITSTHKGALHVPALCTTVIEGHKANSIIGIDLLNNPIQRQALEQARDTGRATATGALQAQDVVSDDDMPEFIVFEPVYKPGMSYETVAEKRAAIMGYIYAVFHADIFFNKIGLDNPNDGTGFRVYTGKGSTQQLLYQSAEYDENRKDEALIHTSKQLGSSWTFEFTFDRGKIANSSQRDTPLLIMAAGLSLAALIAFIVHTLLRARTYELSLQKEHDIALARDELLSLASHQLRTPATTVKQYLGMVLQGFSGELSSQQRTLLEKAYTGNERQLYVINEMLHLAKVDSGRIQLAKREINITTLVSEIVQEQQASDKNMDHIISVRLPKAPIMLMADGHILRMAIENIVNNAIKYTPEGGKISVSAVSSPHSIRIAVRDTGVGISDEDLPKLFHQFSRLSNERSELVGGTGVGLYLAKHLIVLHGGDIEVSSKKGKGTTFTIVLPRQQGKGTPD